jgi:hypothetical protein
MLSFSDVCGALVLAVQLCTRPTEIGRIRVQVIAAVTGRQHGLVVRRINERIELIAVRSKIGTESVSGGSLTSSQRRICLPEFGA